MTKNKIECSGEACFLLVHKKGRGDFRVLFDREDLERVSAHQWCLSYGGKLTGKTKFYPFNFIVGKLHQFIMGKKDGLVVDHIDGDTLNNRRSNLRHITQQQNLWNTPSYKGYYFSKDRKKWRVEVRENGKKKVIGNFETEEEARKCRTEWEQKHQVIPNTLT